MMQKQPGGEAARRNVITASLLGAVVFLLPVPLGADFTVVPTQPAA